jgi:hypothetical protein
MYCLPPSPTRPLQSRSAFVAAFHVFLHASSFVSTHLRHHVVLLLLTRHVVSSSAPTGELFTATHTFFIESLLENAVAGLPGTFVEASSVKWPITPPSMNSSVFQTTLVKSKNELNQFVDSFVAECHPAMKALVSKANHVPSLIPSWTPSGQYADNELKKHISKLCIPMDMQERPSLLLHDLEEETNDPVHAACIEIFFSHKRPTCVT